MENYYSTNLTNILMDLSEVIPSAQHEKLMVALKHQDNINAIIKKRRKIMRRLKVTLPPSVYHKIGVALEIKEADLPDSDRLTLLENRAIHHYLMETEFDPTEWLNQKDAVELMLLQNEEARAFETDEPWDVEFIRSFKQKSNN